MIIELRVRKKFEVKFALSGRTIISIIEQVLPIYEKAYSSY